MMSGRLFFILGELKAFSENLPPEKQEEFKSKLEEAKEESFGLLKSREDAEEKAAEQKRRNGKNTLTLGFVWVLLANFLLFPLVNFIARCFDPNAPQISFEMEKLVRIFLPFLGAG